MTKALPGGVVFEADGASYTLRFGVNELIVLQDRFGCDNVQDALERVESGSMVDMRAAFWAGLSASQPGLTEAEAGEIMSAHGVEGATKLVEQALIKAFPSAAPKPEAGAADASPPPAAVKTPGTGTASTKGGAG